MNEATSSSDPAISVVLQGRTEADPDRCPRQDEPGSEGMADDVTTQSLTPYRFDMQPQSSAHLEVIRGGNVGRRYGLDKDITQIGRSSAVPVCLPYDDVSRVHAQIERGDDEFIITDQESRNGTFVGGVRVHECVLHDGDLVQIGHTLLRFVQERRPVPSRAKTDPSLKRTPTEPPVHGD